MKVRLGCLAVLALLAAELSFALAAPAHAQQDELSIGLRKRFGFNLGSQIQGSFTFWATGPAGLTSVTFLIDGKTVAIVDKSPWQTAINTGDYSLGRHVFTAVGLAPGGRTLTSNRLEMEFVSAASGAGFGLWVLVAVFVVVGLVGAAQFFMMRRRIAYIEPGAPRDYGLAGGAICPRCGRPFPLAAFAPHLLMRTLQRCPYCGKVSLVTRASRDALAAAEAAELQGLAPSVPGAVSDEEKLRRQIEESRFQ